MGFRLRPLGEVYDIQNLERFRMTHIVLSDDQVRAVKSAPGAVELRDEQGNLLGYVARPTSRDRTAEAKRRLNSEGPWHSTDQVLEHLDSLESA